MGICTSCGSEGPCETRFVAVGSLTIYKVKSEESMYKNRDGIRIWEVGVCPKCLPLARLAYMDGKIRSARNETIGSFVALLLGPIGLPLLILLDPFPHPQGVVESMITGPQTFMALAALCAVLLAFVVGLVATPLNVRKLIRLRNERNSFNAIDGVPAEWLDRSAEGEIDRIFSLVTGKRKKRSAEYPVALDRFPLPVFKPVKAYVAGAQSVGLACEIAPQSDIRTWKSHLKLSTAPSREEVLGKLPEEWRSLDPEE